MCGEDLKACAKDPIKSGYRSGKVQEHTSFSGTILAG